MNSPKFPPKSKIPLTNLPKLTFLEFPETEDLKSLEDFLVIEELTRLVDNLEHEVRESSYEIVKLKSENKNLKLKNGILAAINDEDQREIERLR